MEKFKELVSLCKASVSISVNDHRDNYESVEKRMEDYMDEVEPEVYQEMVKRDTVVCVRAYPHTPIGFYLVYHYDIDIAVEQTLQAVKENT